MLYYLDIFFTAFHSIFIVFMLTGWIFPRTRKIHLIGLLAILVVWLLIGLFVGTIGYCPLTDWHWDVKRALGETHLNPSFTGYMFERYLGTNWSRATYDIISVTGLVFGFFMSGYSFLHSLRQRSAM